MATSVPPDRAPSAAAAASPSGTPRPGLLATNLAGVTLRNPVIAAAGTCGYVDELADVLDLRSIGAVTTKSITREPREGNPPWRILDSPRGMLNAIGLANVGLEEFLAGKLRRIDAGLIGSVAGHSVDDYVAVAAAFDARTEIDAIELNVSCPNTKDGLQFGESAAALSALLAEVRPAIRRTPMFVKLSPNVGDVAGMAEAAVTAGADALVVANTFTAMAIDVETRQPRLSRGMGGLSGPGTHPIVVRMVREVHERVARDAGVPIIGLGGVMDWRDAAEFVLAGATAVGMGTALFVDPRRPKAVVKGLESWVRRQGCASIGELVGAVEA